MGRLVRDPGNTQGPVARQGVENLSRVGRQPDRAGTGLAVAKVQIAFTIVGPFKRQDLRLPASGQKKQAHNRRLRGIQELVAVKHLAEPPHLVRRQEPFAPLPAIAPDARAGIAPLRTVAVTLSLAHDHRKNRRRPVCRDRRGMERSEPLPYVFCRDAGYLTPPEPRQDLVLEVAEVDLQRTGFPVPGVAAENLVCHGLEQCLVRLSGNVVATVALCSENAPCTVPCPGQRHGIGIADALPGSVATDLRVEEVVFASRRQYADSKSPEHAIADIMDILSGLEGIDPALGQPMRRHGFLSLVVVAPGTGMRDDSSLGAVDYERGNGNITVV